MTWFLAEHAAGSAPIRVFEPRFWSINFSRPMMGAVTTTGSDSLRADLVFYRKADLAALIWEAEDHYDHPLLKYQTRRDFAGVRMSFDWRSSGVRALEDENGPTLTIEGRNASGAPRIWYVRLANYVTEVVSGRSSIRLDFDALVGGYNLPSDADPVYVRDIDRLTISMVPAAFDAGSSALLPAPVNGWAEVTGVQVTGPTLDKGAVSVPSHRFRTATGYDDSYNLTPERILENIQQLGYRELINHYVGMSHYPALAQIGGFLFADLAAGALNAACAAWHADFLTRAEALEYRVVLSLSYELFDAYAQDAWVQKDWAGARAATGYTPPSTLLSPLSAPAMSYLQAVANAFCQLAVQAGQPVLFQIGEPWWWVPPTYKPCFYDYATKQAYLDSTGLNAPQINDVRASLSAPQLAYMDWLGARLGASTIALRDAVKAGFPAAQTLLLFYAPQVLQSVTPELHRANLPAASWAFPAFDVFQLEDYDFVTAGQRDLSATAAALMNTTLGYPVERQHYFSGFVLAPEQRAQWSLVDAAAEVGADRGVAEVFIWAYPQVVRDGYVHVEGAFFLDPAQQRRPLFARLIKRAAAIVLAQAAAAYQPTSHDDAVAVRAKVADLLEAEMLASADEEDDRAAAAIGALREAVIVDLTARGASLSPIRTFRVASETPALALAVRIYRDASRAPELIAALAPVHPLFMPTTFQALAN